MTEGKQSQPLVLGLRLEFDNTGVLRAKRAGKVCNGGQKCPWDSKILGCGGDSPILDSPGLSQNKQLELKSFYSSLQ